MSDNYPDDIHDYDHDPRSPFYEEPPERTFVCTLKIVGQYENPEDLAAAIASALDYADIEVDYQETEYHNDDS